MSNSLQAQSYPSLNPGQGNNGSDRQNYDSEQVDKLSW